MKSKRVGIITFHCSYNYGSVLQAYALQEFINRAGYDVTIIDYVLKNNFEQYKLFRLNLYRESLSALPADIICFFPNLRRKKAFEQFSNVHLKKTSKRYYDNDNMSELNDKYDTFICGSDQIWNINCTKGIIPAYFLEFVSSSNKKIAYAPSLARDSFDERYFNPSEFRRMLSSFQSIAVREKSTIHFLKRYSNLEIESVLDPTLLLGEDDFEKMCVSPEIKRKFIFLYMLEKRNNDLITYCNFLVEKCGYKVVYISKVRYYSLKNGINAYGCTPEQFLGYIKDAEYVVTNSFHATIFSVIFRKKFQTFTTSRSFARMKDFLEELGLEERIYSQGTDIDSKIDYDSICEKLDELRLKSKKYLLEALEE